MNGGNKEHWSLFVHIVYDGITGVTGVLERYIFPTRQKKTPPKSS
jgi:hypothetical protein